MIVRSIIFYSSPFTKTIAINIAKGLKGYVDVENYSYPNKHIDMDPFHNVIYVVEKNNEDLIKNIKKYAIYYAFKQKYICLLDSKPFTIKEEKFNFICFEEPKQLVVESIEKINNGD